MDYLFVQKYLKARNSHDIAVVVAFFLRLSQNCKDLLKKVVYLMKEMLNKLSKVAKMECS